jgi:hypothetical protein
VAATNLMNLSLIQMAFLLNKLLMVLDKAISWLGDAMVFNK